MQDGEILNHIYHNAQMGILGINGLIKTVDDIPFRKALEIQRHEYQNLSDAAEILLDEKNEKKHELSAGIKMSANMMRSMKTAKDPSVSAAASMMIEGSTKGVIEITRQMKNYSGDHRVENLAKKLLETEQDNINQMKLYL